VGDLARLQFGQAAAFGSDLTVRRKDAGDADQVEDLDAGVAERQLEALQPGAMLAGALGKEHFLGDESFTHVDFLLAQEKGASHCRYQGVKLPDSLQIRKLSFCWRSLGGR
jgi:hypothetical protein